MKNKGLILLGVGVLGYILWKRSQASEETTSAFSNAEGCVAPKVKCKYSGGYSCTSAYQCTRLQQGYYAKR